MQRPPYDSSRWTGDLDEALRNRQLWSAEVGQPYVPDHLRRAGARPLYGADQLRAMAHSALLMVSPILLWLSGVLVQDATSDYLIEAPPVTQFWPAPLVAGFALWFLAEKGRAPIFCRWLGLVGWVAVTAAALAHAATGLYARAHAAPSAEFRGQITDIEISGRKQFKTMVTTLALQDGTSATTQAYPAGAYGSMGRCMAVQRLAGPFGFVWLRITEAAPLPPQPGPGQLAWPVQPVSRAECFSSKPLSELGGAP